MNANGVVWNPERFRELVEKARLERLRWDVCELIGIDRVEYERCLGSAHGLPRLTTAVRVADFFAVSLDFLVGRCTEEEARNLLEDYAENVKNVRNFFGQAFEESWPYNLIIDLYFEPLGRPLSSDQQAGLKYALEQLGDRERDSIVSRYRDGDKETLSEIAERWGVTPERVRQVFYRAMRKLRAPHIRSMILNGFEQATKEDELREKERKIATQLQELKFEQDAINEIREKLGEEKQNILSRYDDCFKHADMNDYIGIEEIGLSVRAYNCLRRGGIETVGDLLKQTEDDLMKIRNLGRKSYFEIVEKTRAFTNVEIFPASSIT